MNAKKIIYLKDFGINFQIWAQKIDAQNGQYHLSHCLNIVVLETVKSTWTSSWSQSHKEMIEVLSDAIKISTEENWKKRKEKENRQKNTTSSDYFTKPFLFRIFMAPKSQRERERELYENDTNPVRTTIERG